MSVVTTNELESRPHNARNTLRIKLTKHSKDDLLVDRKLVMERCPTLAPPLRHPVEDRYCALWDKSQLVKVAGCEDDVRVSTLALNKVEGTYLLEGPEVVAELGKAFHEYFGESDLAAPGWCCIIMGSYYARRNPRPALAKQHLLLFKILAGEPLEPLNIPRNHRCCMAEHVEFTGLIDMCALAEYYGCLRAVVPATMELLENHGGLWEAVSRMPVTYFQLAVKLEWKELYLDSLRHLLAARPPWHQPDVIRQSLSIHFEMTRKELDEEVNRLCDAQAKTVDDLKDELRLLQIVRTPPTYYHRQENGKIPYTDDVETNWNSPSENAKLQRTSRFLACSIYGQWLAAHEQCENMPRLRHICDASLEHQGTFNHATGRLELAMSWHSPLAVFGSRVCKQILSDLGHDWDSQVALEVRQELKNKVFESNKIIEKAFRVREERLADGTVVTFRRANFEMLRGCYFTYLPLDESTFPWQDSENLSGFWQGFGNDGSSDWFRLECEKATCERAQELSLRQARREEERETGFEGLWADEQVGLAGLE